MVEKQSGITLIELMITIAILMISIFAVVPFTRAWIAESNITKTEKIFLEAYTRTKNEAVRNPNGIKQDSTSAVATLSIDNQQKKINVVNSRNENIWNDAIPASVTITLSTSCSDQIPLNNNAKIMTNNCTGYTISSTGGTDAAGTL